MVADNVPGMTIRVGVFGAGGRMGVAVCKAVAADPALELVAAVDPHHAGIDLRQVAKVDAPDIQVAASADEFARANGLTLHGRHHEIYLGDPRRADPEKLKTVLRHPVNSNP